jgi:hypothetical protein
MPFLFLLSLFCVIVGGCPFLEYESIIKKGKRCGRWFLTLAIRLNGFKSFDPHRNDIITLFSSSDLENERRAIVGHG